MFLQPNWTSHEFHRTKQPLGKISILWGVLNLGTSAMYRRFICSIFFLTSFLPATAKVRPMRGGIGAIELTPPVADGLRDPIEISVAKNGDIYVIEREGRLLQVKPLKGSIFEIGNIKVAALHASDPDSPVSREEGLLGLALDPDFENNNRLFIYYSDPQQTLNRLSRFTLKEGILDPASELKLLEIPTERDKKVCHQGGSLAFGPGGLLYMSTGDNTNPFESEGRAPIDNRPERTHFDAQRSAGNSNDLRGKILRIKPTESGYEIPAGNLFAPGTPKTRPEIYVMGCRNPYRISIDSKTGTVYWGEVGPDGKDDAPRGPQGRDEINQAREAGNYGWPFFVADNQPYPIVDFATGQPGAVTDPAKPHNPGIRNTGLTDLPPAKPAFIWYPYADSKEFPAMGSGSRNAMAGPVFHYDRKRQWNLLDRGADATLLTYDWARGKMWEVGLDKEEKLLSVEPLLEGLLHPMDLEVAPDGTMWLLEYGTNWYFNKDGRIRGLRQGTGNHPPEISIGPVAGQADTYEVKTLRDPDGDPYMKRWLLTEGSKETDLGEELTVHVPSASASELRMVVIDSKKATSIARISLQKDSEDALALELPDKPAALDFQQNLKFKVSASGNLDAKGISVRARYIPPTGHDAGGPQLAPEIQALITAKACIACHQVDQTSVGPRFVDVAVRYRDRKDAMTYLRDRLKNGSTGDWGEVPMPAQPAVSDEDAAKILGGVLALADGISIKRAESSGEIQLPAAPSTAAAGGAWEIRAEAPGFLSVKRMVRAK